MTARRKPRAPVRSTSLVVGVLAASYALALLFSFACGTAPLSLSSAFFDASSLDRTLLVTVRLPRALVASCAGAGLAIAGVALQHTLSNPLAEPFVLGVSGGAALGATIAIALGVDAASWFGSSSVATLAVLFGLAATLFVHRVARRNGARGIDQGGARVLLAGVAVNSLAASAITLVKVLAPASRVQSLLFWLVGFIEVPRPAELARLLALTAFGSVLLLRRRREINVLALGAPAARHLGVNVEGLEKTVHIACALIVAGVASTTGLIGFVGLLVPHVLRRLLGPDARVLLPASLLGGAITLVLCDALGHFAFRLVHTTLPVGAVTALLGAPLFLWLLAKR